MSNSINTQHTVCPRSSDPFPIVSYYIKCVTTSWTYCIANFFKPNICYWVFIGLLIIYLYI